MYSNTRTQQQQSTPVHQPLNQATRTAHPTDLHNSEPAMSRLARLSRRSKWVLFTADCPKPNADWLQQARFTTSHLVQMQPSRQLSEKELVLKAMQSGNASAVIASDGISEIDKRHLKQRAQQLGCEVYFVSELSAKPQAIRYH